MYSYYYPPDIAAALLATWPAQGTPLPALPELTQLLMVAYQASLLHEEARPVQCYLLLASPEEVASYPAAQQHHLVFSQPRAYHEQELRRLSPTVQRGTNALAVRPGPDGTWQVWGLVTLGLAADALDPARRIEQAPPGALLVHVRGAGTLTCYCGHERVLALQNGRIEGHGFWQFPQAWAAGHFNSEGSTGIDIVPDAAIEVVVGLALQLLRRSIGRVRDDGHGGMLVLVPQHEAADLLRPQGLLRPKYQVQPDADHFINFVKAIVQRLSVLGEVSWANYYYSADSVLRGLSQQMDWFTELMADLMAVDGALLISQHFHMLGFGVEIHAPFVETEFVYRALNPEATSQQPVAIDGGGTRHRAAYRLCAADPRCLVIVVSQDGAIKFVRQHEGKVVFWDQLAL